MGHRVERRVDVGERGAQVGDGGLPAPAVEVDPGALAVIRRNAAANGVAVATQWLNLAATPPPWAPTVTANLPGDLLLAVAELMERPPQRLVVAGVLEREAAEVIEAFGMTELDRRTEGEWAGVVLG